MDFIRNHNNEQERKCSNQNFRCRSFPEKIKKKLLPENINKLYKLNQIILDLTNELWRFLFKIIKNEEVLDEENVCYDILDPENCDDLNETYHFFNEKLIAYQKHYLDKEKHEEHDLFLKELYYSVLNFLNSPLFSLKNEVKRLIVRIYKPHVNIVFTEITTEEDIGVFLNRIILIYVEALGGILDEFNLKNIPSEIKELKKYIKERIEDIKKRKWGYLEKLDTYKKIKNPTTSTYSPSTTNISTDLNITTSFITEQSNKTSQTDQTNTTSDFFNDIYTASNYSTEQPLKTFDNLETTQPPKFFDKFYKNALEINNSTKNNRNLCLSISDNLLIFGSILSLLFFIAVLVIILIIFVIKNYKLKKNKLKSTELIQLENEPFYSVPIYND